MPRCLSRRGWDVPFAEAFQREGGERRLLERRPIRHRTEVIFGRSPSGHLVEDQLEKEKELLRHGLSLLSGEASASELFNRVS